VYTYQTPQTAQTTHSLDPPCAPLSSLVGQLEDQLLDIRSCGRTNVYTTRSFRCPNSDTRPLFCFFPLFFSAPLSSLVGQLEDQLLEPGQPCLQRRGNGRARGTLRGVGKASDLPLRSVIPARQCMQNPSHSGASIATRVCTAISECALWRLVSSSMTAFTVTRRIS
jgi:hypothetical protein